MLLFSLLAHSRCFSHRALATETGAPTRRSVRNTRTKHNYAELDGDNSIPRPDLDDSAVEIECFNGIRVLKGDRNRSVDTSAFFFDVRLVTILWFGSRYALLLWATNPDFRHSSPLSRFILLKGERVYCIAIYLNNLPILTDSKKENFSTTPLSISTCNSYNSTWLAMKRGSTRIFSTLFFSSG